MVGEDTKNAPDTEEELNDDAIDTEVARDSLPEVGEDSVPEEPITEDEPIDYAELAKSDMEALRLEFPELREKKSITELKNPLRYAALRDLGLTPKEAYLATEEHARRYDNRSHLRSSVPGGARESTDRLGGGELEAARELFSGLSDRELQRLYKKVIK